MAQGKNVITYLSAEELKAFEEFQKKNNIKSASLLIKTAILKHINYKPKKK